MMGTKQVLTEYNPVGDVRKKIYRSLRWVRVKGIARVYRGLWKLTDEESDRISIRVVFPSGSEPERSGCKLGIRGFVDTECDKPVLIAESWDYFPEGKSVSELKSMIVSSHLIGRSVNVAGRILNVREHGRTVFFDLWDINGSVQVAFERHNLPVKIRRGDIVGVEGVLILSGTAEPTIKALSVELLKRPEKEIPPKVSPELGLQKPYLWTICDENRKRALLTKFKVIKAIREFLELNGFVEVETPIINSVCSGANAKPFVVRVNALDKDMFLRPAPELYLKRLIVAGFTKIYEIGKNFRNEGIDRAHQPEFTMVEFYWAYQDYEGMMSFTEKLFRYVVKTVTGDTKLRLGKNEIDFSQPFKRLDFTKTLSAELGCSEGELLEEKSILRIATRLGIDTEGRTPAKILDLLADRFLQKYFTEPTFLIRHPKILSPLAKSSRDNPHLTDRFELFVAGVEVANAYTELDDPIEQERRFLEQFRAREEGDEEALGYDEEFVDVLRYGMPPTAGCGIGIDRLAMLLSGVENIRQVVSFPL